MSSNHSKMRSTQNKGVTFLFCLGYGCQHYFVVQMHNQKLFKASQVSWNQDTPINILSKTHERKVTLGKILEFFLLDTVKTAFQMKTLSQRWTQLEPFFPKLGHFFQFPKKARGGRLTSLAIVACLPCFDEVKVSTVNSDLINFVNFQSQHENIKLMMCF